MKRHYGGPRAEHVHRAWLVCNSIAGRLHNVAISYFGKWGRHLAAGGLYRISQDSQDGQEELVFKIDAHAKPGNTPMVSRLLRLNSAK
jgi:hypothetical protein